MNVATFDDIAAEFIERAHATVWCSAATVDSHNRPRSRILHPIWEVVEGRPIGWIATGRHTLKTKHLVQRPYVSLAYVADVAMPIYAECHAQWADDLASKQRLSEWFGSTAPPLGFDTKRFFGPVDHPDYGVLKLTPWRVELCDVRSETKVWRAV